MWLFLLGGGFVLALQRLLFGVVGILGRRPRHSTLLVLRLLVHLEKDVDAFGVELGAAFLFEDLDHPCAQGELDLHDGSHRGRHLGFG